MAVQFRWVSQPAPHDLRITQVYGFCFDVSGRVLLLEDEGHFGLPGGTPEEGETALDTLIRECLEEAQITLREPTPIGFQEVVEDGADPYGQLRYVATIDSILASAPDIATGRAYRRILVPLNLVPARLNWGIDGLLQAATAASVAMGAGIDVRGSRAEEYV